MKKILALLFLCFPLFLFSQDTLMLSVHFDVDKHDLRPSERQLLQNFFTIHPPSSFSEILLTGHTDSDASEAYNLDLSKRRVFQVKTFLKEDLSISVPISASYHSELVPKSENSTDEGKQANRRVELLFIKGHGQSTDSLLQEEEIAEEDIEPEPIEALPDRDTLIIFSNGIEMEIKAGTFPDRAIRDNCITTTLFPDVKSMMEAGMTTMTADGNVLQTAGVFDVTVRDPNCQSLREGCFEKPVTMRVPAETCDGRIPVSDMRLFPVAANGQWQDQPLRNRVRLVEIEGRYYYEFEVRCPGRVNLDKKMGELWKFKVKLKDRPVISATLYDECCGYIVRAHRAKLNKAKFEVPCGFVCEHTEVQLTYLDEAGVVDTFSMPLSETVLRKTVKRCPEWWKIFSKHQVPRKAVIFERQIEKHKEKQEEHDGNLPVAEER